VIKDEELKSLILLNWLETDSDEMKWDKLEKILLTHNKKDTEKMIE